MLVATVIKFKDKPGRRLQGVGWAAPQKLKKKILYMVL